MLKAYYTQGVVEAGCDEAGRGPLAGSVFCAAVVWDAERLDQLMAEGCDELMLLNDSKQLTEHQRNLLRPWIEANAKAWAVVEVTAEEIDKINILQASLTGMRRALDAVNAKCKMLAQRASVACGVQHVIVDGNKWRPWIPEGEIMAVPADTVVKGDGKYMSIAAASILAKTYRDEYMLRLHEEYPQYGWNHNMGYPTAEHYAAIREYGIKTPIVACTANTDPSDFDEYTAAGMNDILTKPFKKQSVYDILGVWIKKIKGGNSESSEKGKEKLSHKKEADKAKRDAIYHSDSNPYDWWCR